MQVINCWYIVLARHIQLLVHPRWWWFIVIGTMSYYCEQIIEHFALTGQFPTNLLEHTQNSNYVLLVHFQPHMFGERTIIGTLFK